MKEIKAFIRPTCLEVVLARLENAGARDLTITRVDALGTLADPESDRHHLLRKFSEKYSSVTKLELVCRDEEVRPYPDIIKEYAHTGQKGDRRVFVSPVEQAVQIRTKLESESALYL